MVAHPTLLLGPAAGGRLRRPAILQRTDADFLPAFLDELTSETGRARALASVARPAADPNVLRLYQPVHRTFHLVLLHAVCESFREPRLDPASIESAGLVIRRVAGPADDPARFPQGWMRTGNRLRGWVRIPATELDLDPDPERRPPPRRSGHAGITRRLPQPARALDGFAETTAPLFVAPPAVCAAAGQTLLYGMLPTASAEQAETGENGEGAYDLEDAREMLPSFLRVGSHRLNPGDAESREEVGEGLAFLAGLGVFDAASPVALALFVALQSIVATRVRSGPRLTRRLGVLLRQAADVFRSSEPSRLDATYRWRLQADDEDRLAEALRGVMADQLSDLVPGEMRYDPRGGRYRLRAFMRVKQCEACPPELVWSEESDEFEIVPWYESGGAPPVQVALPDLTDPAALRRLKPDVTFITPNALAARIKAMNLDDLAKKSPFPSIQARGFDWCCGFNIPIITICAFIVLFIFLQLLNIVFWWLPYVKICFPIPRK